MAKWYAYDVTRVVDDMLRYDGGYIEESPEELLDPKYLEMKIERFRGATVFSEDPPTIARWESFGVFISGPVRRVRKPTGKMWTYNRNHGWVYETPR